MENQLVERTLEESGYDIESAIKSLQNLCLSSALKSAETVVASNDEVPFLAVDSLPSDGVEWAELLVREMKSATSVEDAKSRATRVLESLERSISAEAVHRGNMLVKENMILKRAVAIQLKRQKERSQEVEHMKQLLAQYQEQLRKLELNNYALTMHLKQSLQNKLMPGYSNPDVL